MNGTGDLGAYADELLRDGRWHDYHEIVTKIAVKVPPGRAVRRAESQRVTASKDRHGGRDNVPARQQSTGISHQVRIGSRHIAKQVLNRTRFEIHPAGPVPPGTPKRVRKRPPTA